MNYYSQRHQHTCGIDLHARTMYLWILDSQGRNVFHQNLPTTPEALLEAIEPFRSDLVIAVECMFAWYWVSDFCRREGIAFALGHALYMKAIHGTKHKNDKLDAEKIARLTYGGNLPTGYDYPQEMRPARDLMRRRGYFVTIRSRLLTHIQTTAQQYNLPPFPKRISANSNHKVVVPHFEGQDEAVIGMMRADAQTVEHLNEQIARIERQITGTAKEHDPASYVYLRSIPGVGKVLALTLLYEIQDVKRFPRVQNFVSYARLVRPQKESGGKRVSGKASKKMGNAHLKWAISEVTTLMMRESDKAKRFVERKSKRYGKSKAMSVLSVKIGRGIYRMLDQQKAFDPYRFWASA